MTKNELYLVLSAIEELLDDRNPNGKEQAKKVIRETKETIKPKS